MTSKRKKKIIDDAKWIFDIRSKKNTEEIEVINAYNPATGKTIDYNKIIQTGWFMAQNEHDLKETLNWCFNGDPEKCLLLWGISSNNYATGTAYICD